jgi:hypothetical protein
MYSRCLSVLALLLLVAAAVAQDVVYDIKALNPNSGRRPPKGVQQHPNEELYDILSKIPDPSSHEDEEHHLGIFEKNGPPFKSTFFLRLIRHAVSCTLLTSSRTSRGDEHLF